MNKTSGHSRYTPRVALLSCVLCALASLALGCSDTAAPVPMEYAGMEPAGMEPAGTMQAGTMPPPQGTNFILQSETPQTIVNVGEMLELRLRYIQNNTSPVSGRRLTFELLNQAQMPSPGGVDGTTLSALSTTTNERGEASVTVFAGQAATSLIVKASDLSNNQAAPIFWRITVVNAGEGGLEITVQYDTTGRYNFNQFSSAQVTLFNNVPCAQIKASAPAFVGAYESLPPIYPYTDLDNKVNSASLPMNLNLSVAALIFNQGGAPVTFGCVEGIRPQGGQLIPVEITTQDLGLVFKGVYTALHRFNMIEALQNSDQLGGLGDVFYFLRVIGGSNEDLGDEVINTVCRIADLPSIACDIVRGVAGGEVGRILNDQLPPNVRQVLRVVGETLDIVGDLTIVGELEFSQGANENGIFVGNDNRWNRIRFNWDIDCAMPGMCQREVTFNQLGRHSRSVAGLFDAQERPDDNRVDILEHNFAIAYGNIILGLLEAWIIPLAYGDGSGNAIQLQDFLRINLMGPCDSINMSLGLPADSETCINTLAVALDALIRDQVGQLNFEEDALVMSGSFNPIDTNNDLSIDKLDDGRWRGVLDGGLTFEGCFTACRGAECDGPVCQLTPPTP